MARKKSIGNQTRPAKRGTKQSGTGSHDPRTGRAGRRHEWDKKRLRAARDRLKAALKSNDPAEVKRALEEVNRHKLAAGVSEKRKRIEEGHGGSKAPAGPKAGPKAWPKAPAPFAADEDEEVRLPFKQQKLAAAATRATAAKKPSSWKRFKDAIGSFFKKK